QQAAQHPVLLLPGDAGVIQGLPQGGVPGEQPRSFFQPGLILGQVQQGQGVTCLQGPHGLSPASERKESTSLRSDSSSSSFWDSLEAVSSTSSVTFSCTPRSISSRSRSISARERSFSLAASAWAVFRMLLYSF